MLCSLIRPSHDHCKTLLAIVVKSQFDSIVSYNLYQCHCFDTDTIRITIISWVLVVWVDTISLMCVFLFRFLFILSTLFSAAIVVYSTSYHIESIASYTIDTVISNRIISYHHRNQGIIPYILVDGTYLPLKMMLLRSCPTDNQLLFRPRPLPTKYSNW